MTEKRFLRLKYTAIRRYGESRYTVAAGVMEFNPNYTVGVSSCEKGEFNTGMDSPYIVELSNGTKFLCFLHNYGSGAEDEVLTEKGEVANSFVDDEKAYAATKKNINKLNNYKNETHRD
jgi:hypothetical protein